MARAVQFILAFVAGIAAVLVALLIPAHLRAVDPRVLAEIGRAGKSLPEATTAWAERNPAAAKMLLHTAEALHLPGTDDALEAIRTGAEEGSTAEGTLLQDMERDAAGRIQVQEVPVERALRNPKNRARLRETLKSPEAARILENLGVTNLIVFAPVRSAAGYPLEASVLVTAFLMQQGAFGANGTDSTLRDEIIQLAAQGGLASMPARARQLEDFYLDMFALAKRLSSEQLKAFVSDVQNLESLDGLARWIQNEPRDLSVIYTSVLLTANGRAIAEYHSRYPDTAADDLRMALGDGVRALNQLVALERPVYRSGFHNELLSDPHLQFIVRPFLRLAIGHAWLAFVCKFILFFCGGLLLAYAVRLARVQVESEPGWVPKFGLARRLTFATLFLMLMVVLGEPYLVRSAEQQAPEPTPPVAPQISFNPLAALTQNTQTSGPMLNQSVLVAMIVFFVLQGSIYVICLTKLAEIRRQSLSSGMKLKLMENEENLFDAGLYCGLFGTAASLILLTLGWIKPSLISAYSSTLFGILFVAILKIFHVRPYKRRLILESATEAE